MAEVNLTQCVLIASPILVAELDRISKMLWKDFKPGAAELVTFFHTDCTVNLDTLDVETLTYRIYELFTGTLIRCAYIRKISTEQRDAELKRLAACLLVHTFYSEETKTLMTTLDILNPKNLDAALEGHLLHKHLFELELNHSH